MSTGAVTIRPLAHALSILLSLTILHLALLPSKRALAEASQYGQQRRQSFLVTQICMGSQSFTNTINLVLTFGRSVLAQPRPLNFGGNLGLNVTLRGLDTLSLRGTVETYCDENVAQALIPVRLSPTIVVTLISPVPYLPYIQKDIAGTLSGLQANVGIRVDRNDPNGRLVISSLHVLNVDTIDVELSSFAAFSGTPFTSFFQLPGMTRKIALLAPVVRAALQVFIDNSSFSL
ncbi:uncharacterized protein LOC125757727 [Rhipicephalus sanguineus]|uniref:uncharacterized protein LOC125757727 n=1 Tax=Rhipicephalus sanguineus TaxID=34632 RepID=UPI0020C4ABEB|nr:uncharacterized protein LOC125757727 [Rhipicephalus sanguineus]